MTKKPLLDSDLPSVGAFCYPDTFVIDVVLSVLLSIVIIGISNITSNILRISLFFKKWLHGRTH